MKMNGDDDDPFASIAKLCRISSSQEILFRNCPFARQSETFSDDDSQENNEAPVQSTPIVMVSLPDDDDTPADVFETPPEEALVVSSSEEQRIATVNDNANRRIDDGTAAVDDGCTEGERTVDLGKDSDPGFSEVKSIGRINSVWGRGTASQKVSGESPSKRLKLCEENSSVKSPKAPAGTVGDLKSERVNPCNYTSKSSEKCHGNEETSVITKHVVSCNGVTKVVESEFEENAGVLGLGGEMANEDSAVRESEEGIGNGVGNGDVCEGGGVESNGKGGSVRRSIEDVEKFRYVGPSPIRGRRELPWSIRGRAENAEAEEELAAGSSSSANPLWKGLRGVLQMLAKRCEPDPSLQNRSLLEIAESRGMTFPQPIWSPAEGFEEE